MSMRLLRQDSLMMLVVGLTIGSCAALQLAFPQRGDQFFRGDTIYAEVASAILERGTVVLPFNDMQMPPGLPALLALVSPLLGDSHEALLCLMAPFLALALWAMYRLLAATQGQAFAAAVCILLATSPELFAFSTQWVFSDLPYLCTSMWVLWLAWRIEGRGAAERPWLAVVLCSVLIAATVLFRSAGVALVAGLAGWLVIGSAGLGKAQRRRRLLHFAPVLLSGCVVVAAWGGWVMAHESVDWPMLEGHPRDYLSHLRVRSGVRPELGTASAWEMVARAPPNFADRLGGWIELFTPLSYVPERLLLPLAAVAAALLVLGLASTLRVDGGDLAAWYFMAHEAMFLLWPWPFELRFALPLAPLACLYLWRGGHVLAHVAARWRAPAPWMRWSATPLRHFAAGLVALAAFLGLARQWETAQANRRFAPEQHLQYARALAGQWLAANTPPTSVVMARQMAVIYHHSKRRAVWFAPISDVRVLMQGIQRLGVSYVIVAKGFNYYWPSDAECMQALLAHYPRAFRVVHEAPRFSVFEVVGSAD